MDPSYDISGYPDSIRYVYRYPGRGEVIAGICASGPRERFSAGALPRTIHHVTEAARTASRLMGADAGKTADT